MPNEPLPLWLYLAFRHLPFWSASPWRMVIGGAVVVAVQGLTVLALLLYGASW